MSQTMPQSHYDCPCMEKCPLHHAMDDVRYFVSTVLAHEEDGFFALAMSR